MEQRQENQMADPEENCSAPQEELEEDRRTPWQRTKESWYDKVPLSLRQLDIIIGVAVAALAVVIILIALDAGGVT